MKSWISVRNSTTKRSIFCFVLRVSLSVSSLAVKPSLLASSWAQLLLQQCFWKGAEHGGGRWSQRAWRRRRRRGLTLTWERFCRPLWHHNWLMLQFFCTCHCRSFNLWFLICGLNRVQQFGQSCFKIWKWIELTWLDIYQSHFNHNYLFLGNSVTDSVKNRKRRYLCLV